MNLVMGKNILTILYHYIQNNFLIEYNVVVSKNYIYEKINQEINKRV